MHVAELALCKELQLLSGWDDTDLMYGARGIKPRTVLFGSRPIPAYDLGYLLRKLPKALRITISKQDKTIVSYMSFGSAVAKGEAIIPEDAACKLAIELFKQGVLTPIQEKK